MIFWRRRRDEELERLLEAVYSEAGSINSSLGLRDARVKKTKDSVEALGSGSLDVKTAAGIIIERVVRALSSLGYTVGGGGPGVAVSDFYKQSGSLPLSLAGEAMARGFDVGGTVLRVVHPSGRAYRVKVEVSRLGGRLGWAVRFERE